MEKYSISIVNRVCFRNTHIHSLFVVNHAWPILLEIFSSNFLGINKNSIYLIFCQKIEYTYITSVELIYF